MWKKSSAKKPGSQPPKPLKRRLTVLILAVFVLSAALRVVGIGAAWATAEDAEMVQDAFGSDTCVPDPAFSHMMEDLTAREARLIEQEVALEQRRVDIEMSREAVMEQLAMLKEAESRLESRLTDSSSASEEDLKQLTAVYEAMKPKVASELFEAMDPEFAAGFLVRMAPESAAAIVSGLKPATAYAVSAIVAGRNAKALKE